MKTKVNIIENNLSQATKEEMWALYKNYYHYTKESFMGRTAKNTHYAMYTYGEKIVGFTGLRINNTEQEDKNVLLIYFGQTVIDKAFRGKSLIPITGAKLLMKYFSKLITGRVCFWADSLTYKAYLVFAKTLEEYYPSYKKETPTMERGLIDFIGETHYKDTYCEKTGTVKKDTKFVNDATTHIRNHDKGDLDILFYEMSNPKHVEGHGLITLGPVTKRNLVNIFGRYVSKYISIPKLSKVIPQLFPQRSLGMQ